MSLMQCPSCGVVGDPSEFIGGDNERTYMVATCPSCGHTDLDEEFPAADDFAETEIDGDDLPHFDEDGFETDTGA